MLQDGWTAVQVACWYDRMKALGALLKWNPDLRLQDSVRFLDSHPVHSTRAIALMTHATSSP